VLSVHPTPILWPD